ncbi:MAG: 50S ribosomal protein L23 [Candidatus Pacearchaeota archaeon]
MRLLATEKAVMKIESENVITVEADPRKGKEEIKKEAEELFEVNVEKIRTHLRGNKKFAYLKLNKDSQAIDVATKMGIM